MSYKLFIFLWFSVWNYLFFLYISNLTDLHQYKTFDAADSKLKTRYEYEDLLNRHHSRSPFIQKTNTSQKDAEADHRLLWHMFKYKLNLLHETICSAWQTPS